MKKYMLLFIASFFSITGLQSQTCSVSIDPLKGEYVGACKKNKAEGKGTAIGIDSYTGDFKNGYPDGQGKYTWKNGNWYEGSWKNGLFDGEGTMWAAGQQEGAIVLKGFWKKGKYIGKYEKPYILRPITNNFNDLTIRKVNTVESEIVISVKSITAGASTQFNLALPKPKLIGIELIEGRFVQQAADETSSPATNRYTLRKVTFPFYAIFSFQITGTGTTLQVERVGVEILENGTWYMQATIDN